jgi:hypothetical protein
MERLSEAATAAAIRVVLMFLLFVFQMQSRTTDYDWLSKIQDFYIQNAAHIENVAS